MTFDQTLEYLYGLQTFGIKLGLDPIRELLRRLEQPQRHAPTLHLAGTNGKGTTAAALAAILTASGHRCGLYTSPHLISFTERIQIDRQAIAEETVCALTAEIREAAQGLSLTFFEFTTAMAFLHFARQKVDVAVIETGMGGRLDATNCLTPVLTLLTPVSLDHRDYLGDDLVSIASEKAGICKPGVPVLIGRQHPLVADVFHRRAQQLGSLCLKDGVDFKVLDGEGQFDYDGPHWTLRTICPQMVGQYPQQNMGLALAAAECLAHRGWSINPQQARTAVEHLFWPGRLEWWTPDLLLDGAHNAHGAEALAAYLKPLNRPVRWIVGIKNDKDVPQLMSPLLPLCKAVYVTTAATGESCEVSTLVDCAVKQGVPARSWDSAPEALHAAQKERKQNEMIVVGGSLYLLGELRHYLVKGQGSEPF